MNKVYFTAPLVALLIFAGVYVWTQSGQKERVEARQSALKAEHAAKLVAEQEARRIALDEIVRTQEQRKKERAEREARETAERELRQAAIDARDLAAREQDRLTREIERLKREVASEQEAVNRLQSDHDAALAEQTFLKGFVPQARGNATELARVLDAIAATEAERMKQAAETPKKKS